MKKRILVLMGSLFFTFMISGCNENEEQENEIIIPKLEELLEVNEIENIIDKNNNVTIETKYNTGSFEHHETQYFHEIDNQIVRDYVIGAPSYSLSFSERGHVIYSSDDETLGISVYEVENKCLGFFEKIKEPKLTKDIYEENEKYVASFYSKASYEDDNNLYFYTIYFDKETYLAESLTGQTYDSSLNEIGSVSSTFVYNNNEFENKTSAYEMHNNSTNPLAINLFINPDEKDELQIKINTDKNAKISVYDANKNMYCLYESMNSIFAIDGLYAIDDSECDLFALEEKPKVSFECNFSEEISNTIKGVIEQFENAGLIGDVNEVDALSNELSYYFDYLQSQYNNHMILYYSTPSEQTANSYLFINSEINAILALYNDTLKELSISSPIKEYIFDGYTKEEIEALQKDNEQIADLQNKVNELEIEYQGLYRDSETWEDDVDNIYLEFIKLNHQIAVLNGYDNYYDYAAETKFHRYYTEEERVNLREYVIEYIIPLYIKSSSYMDYCGDTLTSSEKEDYYDFVYAESIYEENGKENVLGYIDSFKKYRLHDIMLSVFEDDAAVFSKNKESLGTAFATWDPLYEHSVLYFSYYYSDPLTFIHELGHYASFYHYDQTIMGYDVAEIHSQANEWLYLYYFKDKISINAWEAIFYNQAYLDLRSVIESTFIDNFEEAIYDAVAVNTDMTLEEMRVIFDNIAGNYTVDENSGIEVDDLQEYARCVIIENPLYYLSYATSQLVSQSYISMVEEKGFDKAIENYAYLLEEVNPTLDLKGIVEAAGLLNPFNEETYIILNELYNNDHIEFSLSLNDALFAEVHEIRPLFELGSEDYVDDDGRVLMLYFTNNYGEYYFADMLLSLYGNLRMVAVEELINWYHTNKDSVTNWDSRLTDLLGYKSGSSRLGFIALWVDVEDLNRLAYQTDITKQLQPSDLLCDSNGNYLSIDDSIESVLMELRNGNANSNSTGIYTLLGYTYDLASENEYGLSEFVLNYKADVIKEASFENADKLIEWLETLSN